MILIDKDELLDKIKEIRHYDDHDVPVVDWEDIIICIDNVTKMDEMDDTPTVDIIHVVQCKDCHYAKPYNKIWQLPKRDTLVCTYFAGDEVDNNFFCGYAIKKMDEVKNEID